MSASTWWSRWPTAALVAGALLVGTVIGPAIVQAATAGLVRLEGGGSSHVAKVSSSGQLSVNPGLTQTAAHQILAVQASPSSYVAKAGRGSCSKGGLYQIPRGDAFILTGAEFSHVAPSSGPEGLIIWYGPTATPCMVEAAFSVSEAAEATDNQVYQPGIAIPAGDAIGVQSQGDDGGVEIYGYLVPASEVPRHAATAGSGRTSLLPLPGR
jgi:hypothetical protein